MTEMVFEFIEDPEIVITRARSETTTEQLMLTSIALGKIAHAYDYGRNAEAAQTRDRWALLTVGAIAALKDLAQFYRRTGEDPERAAVLGARIALAMRNSRRGVHEDELHDPMAITSTQGVPGTEFSTLITLAMLTVEAAEALKETTSAEKFPVQRLTEETGDASRAEQGPRWAGILAARLDRPDLLEAETQHVMRTTLGALVDGHPGIKHWIPPDRDPTIRVREPREHPGTPLVLNPFIMESKDAWEAVEAGEVVDQAFVKAAPTVVALRAELARGPAKAS